MLNSIIYITIDCRMINSSGIGTYIINIIPLVIGELYDITFYLLGNNAELSDTGILDNSSLEQIEFNSQINSLKE